MADGPIDEPPPGPGQRRISRRSLLASAGLIAGTAVATAAGFEIARLLTGGSPAGSAAPSGLTRDIALASPLASPPAASGGPTIYEETGELDWMHADLGRHATNLQVIEYQGQPALCWWEGTVKVGIGDGECVIVDRPADPPSGSASPAPAQVLDSAVVEIDLANGQRVFEWHSVDHIELDETYLDPPGDSTGAYDYVHCNSIDVDHDGRLLVSARNTSAVYKIDRGTGEIVWRLGGRKSNFAMGDGADFGWQHDVRRQVLGTSAPVATA